MNKPLSPRPSHEGGELLAQGRAEAVQWRALERGGEGGSKGFCGDHSWKC